MPRTFIRQPNRPSESARALAREMGVRMIRRTNSRYTRRPSDVIINWGNPLEYATINKPEAVALAIDKRATYAVLEEAGVPTVEHTDCEWHAAGWIARDDRLLVRTSLRSSQGRGITVYSKGGTDWSRDWYDRPQDHRNAMYVKVFGRNPQHVTEYRVHVVKGQVIDYAQKKRRSNYEQRPNPYVRSWGNGWVFARSDVVLPPAVNEAALGAVEALGLDFGAVDVASDRDGGVCVYEVNTAPGLEGSTLTAYADALSR